MKITKTGITLFTLVAIVLLCMKIGAQTRQTAHAIVPPAYVTCDPTVTTTPGAPPCGGYVNSSQGRFQLVVGPGPNAVAYLLDSQSGAVWREQIQTAAPGIVRVGEETSILETRVFALEQVKQ